MPPPIHSFSTHTHTFTYAAVSANGAEQRGAAIVPKLNQDAWIVAEDVRGNDSQSLLFGVCDGHGPDGAFISTAVCRLLGYAYVTDETRARCTSATAGITMMPNPPPPPPPPTTAIQRAFLECDEWIKCDERPFNTSYSGTTAVFTLVEGRRVTVAHVGDSRCLIGAIDPRTNQVKVRYETQDHCPAVLEERERILDSEGRIEPMRTESGHFTGPERLWLPDRKCPGITMTRAFGDAVGHQIGVIADPEISVLDLQPDDKYLVLCSDGVIEFLSNDQVMQRVHAGLKKGLTVDAITQQIVDEARSLWSRNEGTIDDCTLIVCLLDHVRSRRMTLPGGVFPSSAPQPFGVIPPPSAPSSTNSGSAPTQRNLASSPTPPPHANTLQHRASSGSFNFLSVPSGGRRVSSSSLAAMIPQKSTASASGATTATANASTTVAASSPSTNAAVGARRPAPIGNGPSQLGRGASSTTLLARAPRSLSPPELPSTASTSNTVPPAAATTRAARHSIANPLAAALSGGALSNMVRGNPRQTSPLSSRSRSLNAQQIEDQIASLRTTTSPTRGAASTRGGGLPRISQPIGGVGAALNPSTHNDSPIRSAMKKTSLSKK